MYSFNDLIFVCLISPKNLSSFLAKKKEQLLIHPLHFKTTDLNVKIRKICLPFFPVKIIIRIKIRIYCVRFCEIYIFKVKRKKKLSPFLNWTVCLKFVLPEN